MFGIRSLRLRIEANLHMQCICTAATRETCAHRENLHTATINFNRLPNCESERNRQTLSQSSESNSDSELCKKQKLN